MTVEKVLKELEDLSTPEHFAKLSHFGITNDRALGVKVPLIRQLAKKIKINHQLALDLWQTEVHEARILATMIDDSKLIDENQFDDWVGDFDSWDICDQCCGLFIKTPFALERIGTYSHANEEFVKRTAFVLMCALVIKDKKAGNESFYHFFELIEREAWDNRNFVRKAVNWALRQIGKRNEILRIKAIECGERILRQESKSAKWIANDALRELRSEKTITYVNRNKSK